MAIRFKTIRQRKYEYLINAGFLPSEAEAFSRTSRRGMSSPYFRRMINSRRRTVRNLQDAGRTSREITEFIRNQYLANKQVRQDSLGRTRIDPWQLLRYHEERSFRRGEEYESPWKKKTRRRAKRKRERKRITKKDMLKSRIIQLERRIERTPNDEARMRLDNQKADYEAQLRRLNGE